MVLLKNHIYITSLKQCYAQFSLYVSKAQIKQE